MAKKKRAKPSELLGDVSINTSLADYERVRTQIRKSRERLLVPKKKREKNGKSKRHKVEVRFPKKLSGGQRNKRRFYGLRIYIRFIGIQYLSKQEGKYIKHVRFNRNGTWRPKSEKEIRGPYWKDVYQRMQRQYKDKISAYRFNVTYLTKDSVKKLGLKPD